MVTIRAVSLGLLVATIGQAAFARDANAQQDQATTKAAIVMAQGLPGESRPAPVELSLADGVRIGSLSLTIRYPARLATFQKAELSGGALALGAEVTTDVTKQEADEGIVQVTIAMPERDSGRSAVPDGRIASLWFQIARDAPSGTVIALEMTSATAAAARGGTGPVNVQTEDGEIRVSSPIVSVCFFYMH